MIDVGALQKRWDDLVLTHPELGEEGCLALRARQLEQGASFDGRALCQVLRPNLISATHLAAVSQISRLLASALRKLTGGQTRGPHWVEQADLTEEAARLIAIDPGFDRLGVTVRLDAFEAEGRLSFVELNAEAPAGIAYHDVLARLFDELPVVEQLRNEGVRLRPQWVVGHLLQALLTTYRNRTGHGNRTGHRDWAGHRGKPRIAIVDWRESPTVSEFQLLAEAFTRRGYRCVVADPRDLRYRHGRLFSGRSPIDMVYRRVLFSDCLARRDDVAALVSAVENRAVCMVNPFRAAMFHRKRLWADLTQPDFLRGLLPGEEAVVRAHIPWTRRFREGWSTDQQGASIDLVPWVRERRASLVLKPDHSFGGKGVHLGWQLGGAAWDEVIEEALAGDYVVQRAVPLCYETFPLMDGSRRKDRFLVDQAPYLFRGKMGGFLTRLSTGPLANVTAGGSMVPSFVVGP